MMGAVRYYQEMNWVELDKFKNEWKMDRSTSLGPGRSRQYMNSQKTIDLCIFLKSGS